MPDPIINQFGELRPIEHLVARKERDAAFAAGDAAMASLSDANIAAFDAAAASFAKSQYKAPPPPTGPYPYRMSLADILGANAVAEIEKAGRFVFHSVGDTGEHGHGAEAQESVSFHMERQIKADNVAAADRPALFYHLGDVVYYNGELNLYPEQFYDPYQYYTAPIIAIPGNHDGDPIVGDTSLSGFTQNFCTPVPQRPPMPGMSQRLTMTQPNVYFTLQAPFITIIGLYSNTTGDIDDPKASTRPQFDWLVSELGAADTNKFLVVAVHHPPFSADNIHGGEHKVGKVLDEAFARSGRLPHLVLTAHVHDYQKFMRDQSAGPAQRTVPYIVAGAGGYAGYGSLHHVLQGVPFPAGVKLVKSNDKLPGFLRLTVASKKLTGEYFVVPKPPDHISEDYPATLFDSFSVDL